MKRKTGKRGSPPAKGTLTFSIRLWGEFDAALGPTGSDLSTTSKIFVGFDSAVGEHWHFTDIDPFTDDDDYIREAPKLWRYRGEERDAHIDSWFFCFPLLAISSTEDVKREIVDPLIAMLDGKGQTEAFPERSFAFDVLGTGTTVP